MTLKFLHEVDDIDDPREPCAHCKKRTAEIVWHYMAEHDFGVKLCRECDQGFLELRLCCQCATHHALAILRDVAEIKVGEKRTHARYRDALSRCGL